MFEDIPKKKKEILGKRGIFSGEDLCHTVPYKFYDFTRVIEEPSLEWAGRWVCLKGRLSRVNKRPGGGRTTVACRVSCNGLTVFVNYIGQARMEAVLSPAVGREMFFCGKLEWNPEWRIFSMLNPMRQSTDPAKVARWTPVYPKFKGIGDDWLRKEALSALGEPGALKETIPAEVISRLGLPGRREALLALHCPKSAGGVARAAQRCVFEDLLYFSCRLEEDMRKASKGSAYNMKTMKPARDFLGLLPYPLTADQGACLSAMLGEMKEGRRVNALVQGDVGCGKSVVAFALMVAMAGSGYQAAIMAPTVVLAEQHYAELSSYAERLGMRAALLGGRQTAKEKREALKGLADGSIQLAVGTHSLVSDGVGFRDLALAVVDEEHRFGVRQRERLAEKARHGTHTVSFTATPIPRSMADTLYKGTEVFEIKTMPPGRSPVRTYVMEGEDQAMGFVRGQVAMGRQAYVVCPLVDAEDDAGPRSVAQVAKAYGEALGVEVGVATGKQSKEKTSEALRRFKEGEIPVLAATTVVEVGVNVPNATVIVVEDAWMFGLSQLHQLRGRVGRGSEQGHCILRSDRGGDRLSAMLETTDGFKIAEMDLGLRGAGNVIGEEQSGKNRFIGEALSYPKIFAAARREAAEMVDYGLHEKLMESMERRSEKAYVKAQKLKIFR